MNTDLEQHLYRFILQWVQPTEVEWKAFVSNVKFVEYDKGDLIESIDDKITNLHFVIEGIARHYFFDKDNNEITIWISEAGGLSTDYAAFTKGDTTKYQIQAITPVKTICITSYDLNALYDEFKVWERLGRLINQQYLNDFIERNNFLIMLSAKQRYDTLYTLKPHLFNMVPLKHLASYLGITVETLSRLRSNTY